MKTKQWLIGVMGVILELAVSSAWAVTTTVINDGDWNVGANWDNGVPNTGYDVVIPSGRIITNTAATKNLNSLDCGGTLVFSGWDSAVTATVVTISGTVTHTSNTDTDGSDGWTPDARVYIVCGNLTVASGGVIDADAKGYLRGFYYASDGYTEACGPGAAIAGTWNGSGQYVGAGHGGRGGQWYYQGQGFGAGGATYGSRTAPVDPGSGGGFGNSVGTGGDGGGAVRIEASGTVTVNGTIKANAGHGWGNGAGGSGGSIFITCSLFASTNGIIQAIGGNGNADASSGGGGRIAIHYATTEHNGLQISASPGVSGVSGGFGDVPAYGDVGTVDMSDMKLLAPDVSLSGELPATFTTVALDSLSLNEEWLRFPADGLTLTITNGLAVSGSNPNLHKLEAGTNATVKCGSLAVTNGWVILYGAGTAAETLTCNGHAVVDGGSLRLAGGEANLGGRTYTLMGDGPVFTCGGTLTLTNGGSLTVESGPMSTQADPADWIRAGGDSANAMAPCGGLVNVTGDVVIAAGSWIYPYSHPTNGASVLFKMKNIEIAAGAGFNADAKGYAGGWANPDTSSTAARGFGPGNPYGGWLSGDGYYAGGGYGGAGGASTWCSPGGSTYGSSNAPVDPGSGGGRGNAPNWAGNGGGVVRIKAAGTVTLNGTLSANGANQTGAGSGGGIYVTCKRFDGMGGTLSANGGASIFGGGGGGGGGGRIALLRETDGSSSLTTAVNGGAAGGDGVVGDVGTVVLAIISPPAGTLMIVR